MQQVPHAIYSHFVALLSSKFHYDADVILVSFVHSGFDSVVRVTVNSHIYGM